MDSMWNGDSLDRLDAQRLLSLLSLQNDKKVNNTLIGSLCRNLFDWLTKCMRLSIISYENNVAFLLF